MSTKHHSIRRGPFVKATCLGLLLSAGCATFSQQARDKLIVADTAYRKGDYRAAETQLNSVITEFPSASESAEAYYIRGLCHAHALRAAAAESDFRRCLSLSKRPDLTARAEASLGHLFFDAANFPEAAQHYAISLPALAGDPGAAHVHLRYGICLQRLGKWDDAREQFSTVLHRYAGSRQSEEARRRFAWTQKAFSIQCGVFQQPAQADALLKKLKAAGQAPRRVVEARGNVPVHVVYVGAYPTYAQAQTSLATVRRSVSDALIVP